MDHLKSIVPGRDIRRPGKQGHGRRTGVGSGRGRASLSQSNLVRPDSPIYAVANRFQDYMHLPDPMPLYALMSAVAGNMMTGFPIWLMVVGTSGGGKSEILKSIETLKYTRKIASISGPGALLSGVKKKDRAVDASGGILREMQWGDQNQAGFGCLICGDFTETLSMQEQSMKALLGALRDVYDGDYVRDLGGEGGKTGGLRWTGKMAFVGGVTHIIDRYHEVIGVMGERFLYVRLAESDGYHESLSAANNIDPGANVTARQQITQGLFEGLGLGFDHPTMSRLLTRTELNKIVGYAQFGSRARTPVARDRFSTTREISETISYEAPTRMTNGLSQLYRGAEAVGLDQEDRWKLMLRIAMDSIPLTRANVLKKVMEVRGNGHGWPAGEVAKAVRCGDTGVRRELENLGLLGVIEKTGVGWKPTGWTVERIGETK